MKFSSLSCLAWPPPKRANPSLVLHAAPDQYLAEPLPRLVPPVLTLGRAGSRNRTRDILITKEALYQLSYTGI